MNYAVISTWKMSWNGCCIAAELLKQGKSGADAIVRGIQDVEDNPAFHSVGYGGLPDEEGEVCLDGGFMDGDTLRFGAVASLRGFRSPIEIACSLKDYPFNNFLCAEGAEKYAEEHGFARQDNRTEECMARFAQERERHKTLSAYNGHDTVCFAALDQNHTISAGVSTSGLFLKKKGRIGDSPVPGCGYYADSEIGAACATGVGEDIMKGVLSFRALGYLREGLSGQEAAEKAVSELTDALRRRNGKANAMSLILLDKNGCFGVGTNVRFPFVYASSGRNPTLYLAEPSDSGCRITEVSDPAVLDID